MTWKMMGVAALVAFIAPTGFADPRSESYEQTLYAQAQVRPTPKRKIERKKTTRTVTSGRTTTRGKKDPPLDSWGPSPEGPSPEQPPSPQRPLRGRSDAKEGRRTMAKVMPALDDFPYQSQDFSADERVFRGKKVHNDADPTLTWQQYAYDLGANRKQKDGTWIDKKPTTDWNNPKNSDFYIYRKPVYAISEGMIVNCWRNAPENPRPYSSKLDKSYDGIPLSEQTWLHADTRAGKSFGAGNFIGVLEDNGNFVGYAHGRPGTVPQKLCPHNGKLLPPSSWKADSAVPTNQQVRVKRGDFLFETGNAGTSSAPHLHIDRVQPDRKTSVMLLFRNGLANPLKNGKLKNAKWTSFAGQQIPAGPVLVWPPRRPGGLWSWHGLTAKSFGAYFNHMADSGYQLVWIDGYSVKGTPYFNTVWRPAKAAWHGYALLTGAEYQAKFKENKQAGFALTHVDSVLVGGNPRYNAIFVKGASMDFIARHGQDNAGFNATFKDVAKKGYSPVSASVVSVNGKLQYTTLYRKQNIGGWVLLPGIPKGNYQKVYNENKAKGRRPRYVNAFKQGDGVFYSVVFAQKPGGPRKDRHGMSRSAYQKEFNSAGKLPIRAVSGVDGARSNHEYIAVWRKNN